MPTPTLISRWQDGALHWFDRAGNFVNVDAPHGFFHHFRNSYYPLTLTAENSGTAVDGAEEVGSCLITTGGADDNCMFLASNRCFVATKGLVAVARFKLPSNAAIGWNFVFTDAQSESALLPLGYATTTLTNTATNAGGILFDTDATTDNILGAVSDDTSDATLVTVCAAASVDTSYHEYKLVCDTSGYMSFYYDGTLAGTSDVAMDTADVYCAMIAVSARTGAAKALELDYFGAWQATR